MKITYDAFQAQQRQAITLLGMSGVGKTRLAHLLRKYNWFHYSGDYRIGTRYLNEFILDNIKCEAMKNPLLRDLLLSDAMHINNNISIDNLQLMASFLGKLGDPMRGGLGLAEFRRRLRLHHTAETAAMLDVPDFIDRAYQIYGYKKFVNDAGGSLCELDDRQVLECLSKHTVILYIQASAADEQELIQRAIQYPKPMYYRENFLHEQLSSYLKQHNLRFAALMEPDDFARYIFPQLFRQRIPRYEAIAAEYGYTMSTEAISSVHSEADLFALLASTLD